VIGPSASVGARATSSQATKMSQSPFQDAISPAAGDGDLLENLGGTMVTQLTASSPSQMRTGFRADFRPEVGLDR